MILVAALRRTRSNEEFFADVHGRYFRTSGRVVMITSILAFCLYVNLIVLLLYKWWQRDTLSLEWQGWYFRVRRTVRQCNSVFYSILKWILAQLPPPILLLLDIYQILNIFPLFVCMSFSPLLCIIQSICVLIKHHISIITDILTHSTASPRSKEDIRIIMLIMITHDLTNCLCCFPSIIKWNTRAEMMSNVSLKT